MKLSFAAIFASSLGLSAAGKAPISDTAEIAALESEIVALNFALKSNIAAQDDMIGALKAEFSAIKASGQGAVVDKFRHRGLRSDNNTPELTEGISMIQADMWGGSNKSRKSGSSQGSGSSDTYMMETPKKTSMCWSDKEKDLMLKIEPSEHAKYGSDEGFGLAKVDSFMGFFSLPKPVTVDSYQDVIVDVHASTGTLMFSGYDYKAYYALAETPEEVKSDIPHEQYLNWASVNEASIKIGVELFSSNGVTKYPVPQSLVTLSSIEDVIAFKQDDSDTADDDQGGFHFQTTADETNSARFVFPGLTAGKYGVRVRVYIDVGTELHEYNDDDWWATLMKVTLGPHSLVATVVDAAGNECGEINEFRRV